MSNSNEPAMEGSPPTDQCQQEKLSIYEPTDIGGKSDQTHLKQPIKDNQASGDFETIQKDDKEPVEIQQEKSSVEKSDNISTEEEPMKSAVQQQEQQTDEPNKDAQAEPLEEREYEEGDEGEYYSEPEQEGGAVEEVTADIETKMARLAHTRAERIGGARRPHHAHGGHRVAVAADLGLAGDSGLAAIPHPPSPKRAPKLNPATFHPPNMDPKHQHGRPKEMPTARQEPGSRFYQKGNKVRMSDIKAVQQALQK